MVNLLLGILSIGTLAFILLAIAPEWTYFASLLSWLLLGLAAGTLVTFRAGMHALANGERISFAGLETWSAIDISWRNCGRPVVVGASVALPGAITGPIARWRRR